MESVPVERDGEDAEYLIGWPRDEDFLRDGAQVVVGPAEVACFFDDDGLVATFATGRYLLTPQAQPALAKYLTQGPPELGVAFVSLAARFDVVDSLGEFTDAEHGVQYEAGLEASFTVHVRDPARLLALDDELDEDVSTDDFVYDTLLDAASAALAELGPTLSDLAKHGGKVPGWEAATLAQAKDALGDVGLEAELAGDLRMVLDDPATEVVDKLQGGGPARAMPARPGGRSCAHCGGYFDPDAPTCPACGGTERK